MGRDLLDGSKAARAVFETADRVLGYELSRICFEGPEERLRETEYAQPAILTVSLAALAATVENGTIIERPAFTAGHSLGEYTALIAAGALSLEDGLRLIAERARLMADAGRSNPGTLAAIIGLDEAIVTAICFEADIDVCNLNLPSQTVVGGPRANVEAALRLAKERGAQKAMELNVSGAFHSRLMTPALAGLAEAIAAARIEAPAVHVVANSSARPLTDAGAVATELREQIAKPVFWHQSVTLMAEAGVSRFVEFGPGRVLTGMVKRLVPGAGLRNIGTLTDAESVPGGVTATA